MLSFVTSSPLFAFALVAGKIPDFLFCSGIEKVQALQAGVILLLEPISAVILSVVLLIATPSLVQAGWWGTDFVFKLLGR